ncbi:MAG: intradiol ring-cleavage dioxygenase [Armatimonadota bacterium]
MEHNDDQAIGKILTRREALAAAGATSLLFLANRIGFGAPPASKAGDKEVDCVVATPALTEGPFFVDENLNRSDVRPDSKSGKVSEGVPLSLTISLVKLGTVCTAIKGAHVDIWHCDSAGRYSDEDNNGTAGQDQLRGYQVSDEEGQVKFTTVYPGWYNGRAVHIHFKIRIPQGNQSYEFTSQIFFDDKVSDSVFQDPPYKGRGQRDMRNEDDGIFLDGGASLVLKLTKTEKGFSGALKVGLTSL